MTRQEPGSRAGLQSGCRRELRTPGFPPPKRGTARVVVAAAAAVLALAAPGCEGGKERPPTKPKPLPRLFATVGTPDDPDAYDIHLQTANGDDVTTILPPGRYELRIDDRSTIHSFHLRGRYGGADVASDVAGTGEQTVVVLLPEPGSYDYFCDAHPRRMNVTFSIHGRIRTQN